MLPASIKGSVPFLGVEHENSALHKAAFLLLPVPYEATTSYKKGARFGPKAFLEASAQVELWDEELGFETWQLGIHTAPAFEPQPSPEASLAKVKAAVRDLTPFGKPVFIVGGEHTLTGAIVPVFAERYRDLSVLQIDAHADLRDEYEGTPLSHACALRPVPEVCPLVQVGIRSVGPEEKRYVNAGSVRTFLAHETRDMARLIPQVLSSLSKTVYITIDLDGFDPSVFPGVGTPQPGGLGWYEGLDLLRAVIQSRKIVGVDLMELCPLQDNNISEFNAAKLAYRLMGYIAKANGLINNTATESS
jgi:agmatinase